MFPYRFQGTGPRAGTTFVYPGDGTVITYTGSTEYRLHIPRGCACRPANGLTFTMTPAILAQFESMPLR